MSFQKDSVNIANSPMFFTSPFGAVRIRRQRTQTPPPGASSRDPAYLGAGKAVRVDVCAMAKWQGLQRWDSFLCFDSLQPLDLIHEHHEQAQNCKPLVFVG